MGNCDEAQKCKEWQNLRGTTIIEVPCYKDSLMGQFGLSLGARVVRITREDADMTTKEGLSKMLQVVRDNPGADLWGSLPCTTECRYHHMNCATHGEEYRQDLERRRKQLDKLVIAFR